MSNAKAAALLPFKNVSSGDGAKAIKRHEHRGLPCLAWRHSFEWDNIAIPFSIRYSKSIDLHHKRRA
jgi:hypothetical protein